WFLSLIVACYVVAALVRACSRAPGVPRAIVAALLPLTAVLVAVGFHADFTRQMLAFLAGLAARQHGLLERPPALLAGPALLGVAAIGISANFAYAGWAVALFLLFAALALPAWRPVRLVSDVSYELFLVHGPLLVLAAR